jgi:hypothetical protein
MNFRRFTFTNIGNKLPVRIIVAVLIIFSSTICFSQARIGTALEFLLETPDTRGRSLAGGGSVFSDGAVSSFYNPANLVSSGVISAEFDYCLLIPEYSREINLTTLYIAKSFNDRFYLGLNISRLGYGTTDFYSGPLGMTDEFTSYDASYGLSAAIDFDSSSSIGFGLKYIQRNMWEDLNGSTTALDIGFQLRNQFPQTTLQIKKNYYPTLRKNCRLRDNRGVSFGISIVNIGKGIAYIDDGIRDPLPRRLLVAAGYQIIDSDQLGLRATLDGSKILLEMDDGFNTEWREIEWSYGVEASLLYIINLRAGRHVSMNKSECYNAVGFGLGPDWLHFDYSHISGDPRIVKRSGQHSFSIIANIHPEIFRK